MDESMNVPDPMEGAPAPEPAKPERITCTATNRQGKRCGKSPVPGAAVCRMHGGAAPQVKAKAEERLRALQAPALAALEDLIENADARTRVKIAEMVFDRTGLHPKQTTQIEGAVSIEQTNEWRLVRQALVETLGAEHPELLERFEARLYELQHP